MGDVRKESVELHRKHRGKLGIRSLVPLNDADDLSLAYTPGVAEPCRVIAADKDAAWDLTLKGRTVAVITDGSAVLGLGDIGPEASLPVMEGKAVLFKEFAGVDAFPLALTTKDPEEFIATVERVAPAFGAINLEDISAPRCFIIERELKERLDIPVFHDDQHGTAVVVTAALFNALRITGRRFEDLKIVIAGAGAAGQAITHMMCREICPNVILIDSKGAIHKGRDDLDEFKTEIARKTNIQGAKGDLSTVIKDADVFIGVSRGGILSKEMVKSMRQDPIIFALANPEPEMLPEDALAAGAAVVATGRSDYPNQINNVLAFPGIMRGALDVRASDITEGMKHAAAQAIASLVPDPTPERIIPDPFDERVARMVAEAVSRQARDDGVSRV